MPVFSAEQWAVWTRLVEAVADAGGWVNYTAVGPLEERQVISQFPNGRAVSVVIWPTGAVEAGVWNRKEPGTNEVEILAAYDEGTATLEELIMKVSELSNDEEQPGE